MKYFYKLVLVTIIIAMSAQAMDVAPMRDSNGNEEKKDEKKQNVQPKSAIRSNTNDNITVINEALINAIKKDTDNDAYVCFYCIQCNANPSAVNKYKMSAISTAAQMGKNCLLESLIAVKKYADMTSEEKVLYDDAISSAVNCVIFKMVEEPKNIGKLTDTLKILLKSGANPNYILVQLAQYHITQLAPMVIEHMVTNSHVNEKIEGKTTLWLVAQDAAICKLLASNGADINAKNDVDGETVLMRFARFGDDAMVESLRNIGADIDAQDKEGATALIIAVKACHQDVVQKLIHYKAALHLTDKSGKTALDYAQLKAKYNSQVGCKYRQITTLLNI